MAYLDNPFAAVSQSQPTIKQQDLQQALLQIYDECEKDYEKTRPLWLAHLKQVFDQNREQLNRQFYEDQDGLAAAAGHALFMDQIIQVLFNLYETHIFPNPNPTIGEKLTIIAVGGYGRAALAPYSDIDLLFLYDHKPNAHIEQLIESILYCLWDLGLKVGQASRGIRECLRLAAKDMTILTTLLESRFIAGHRPFYDQLYKEWSKSVMQPSLNKFLEAKLQEREDRHHRLGDSRYLLEPNIKEGKGGQRDLQLLRWAIAGLLGHTDMGILVEQGTLTCEQVQQLHKCDQFLMTLRVHLHLWSGRVEERLTFAAQPEIAARMGYKTHAGTSGTERLMKHYFINARHIAELTRIFMAFFERVQQDKGWLSRVRPNIMNSKLDGFVLKQGRLLTATPDQFKQQPIDIIRLFKVACDHQLDLHPDCWQQIAENLRLINSNLRKNKQANRYFMDILCAKQNPETILRWMNESGVLGRFVPDFGRVVAQMQFDMYHIYTTDEHTIRAIGALHQIEQGELEEEHPLSTNLFPRINQREALYTAVFLHDIAKGRGGDHSELGAEVALKLCPRFGFDAEQTQSISWLVRYHLLMSRIVTKRDLDDPKTITDFVDQVQTPELLRMLLCLTVVDIKAVGPKSWNNWKASLLRNLYGRAEALMTGSSDAINPTHQRLEERKGAILRLLQAQGWSEQDITEFMEANGDQCLRQYEPALLAKNADLIKNARHHPHALNLTLVNDEEQDITQLSVCCPTHPGLFSRIAGAIALGGGEVRSASIITLADGLAVTHFAIQTAEGKCFLVAEDMKHIQSLIDEALCGALDVEVQMQQQRNRPLAKREIEGNVASHILIDNQASSISTVIEVQGRDDPGMLYYLTGVLARQNLQILSAKIFTYGEKLVDVFYVRDVYGHKITHQDRLKRIEQDLLATFN